MCIKWMCLLSLEMLEFHGALLVWPLCHHATILFQYLSSQMRDWTVFHFRFSSPNGPSIGLSQTTGIRLLALFCLWQSHFSLRYAHSCTYILQFVNLIFATSIQTHTLTHSLTHSHTCLSTNMQHAFQSSVQASAIKFDISQQFAVRCLQWDPARNSFPTEIIAH